MTPLASKIDPFEVGSQAVTGRSFGAAFLFPSSTSAMSKGPRFLAAYRNFNQQGANCMASIPITIQGVMFYTGLEVGGGPMPGGPPLGFWGGVAPPLPTHPIAPGGPPPGIWGPTDPRPTPPIYFPPGGGGQPPVPTHPIAPGGPPLGFWGGAPIPWPTPPIYYPPGGGGQPPTPTHPIVLPPVTPGGPPVQIWPSPGVPTHPIVMPPLPEAPPDTGEGGGKPPPPEGGWGFHPAFGWGYFPAPIEPGPKG